MKKLITSIFALSILLSSCAESTENTDAATEVKEEEQAEVNNEEVVSETTEDIGEAETENEELLNYEGSDVEDDRFDNLCTEKVISDCYIVDHFIYMDAVYINVDFVNYKVIETDSEPEYELVNEKNTIRTFLVMGEYLKCGRDEAESIEELLEKVEQDPKTLFNLEADEGIVNELFVRNCAG